MKRIASMSAEELAAFVCQKLTDAGIVVTLTGGACVAIWSNGAYTSRDLDMVEQGLVARRDIRRVVSALGFVESHRFFHHPDAEFIIEFPSGPLAVGNELVHRFAERTLATGMLRLLTPTDCVKDRLAAWFHWRDRQALAQAVLVARAQAVDLGEIRAWSGREGCRNEFEVFLAALRPEPRKRKPPA